MSEKNNNGKRLRKLLFNEISFIFSICAVVIGIFIYFTKPDQEMAMDIALIKQDIQTIKNNELSHIQENLDRLCSEAEAREKLINENQAKIIRILTILETNH